MAEILKEWLTERLQRNIKWEANEFGDVMKNGHIIASVLYSYNVINEEKLFLIRPSNLKEDIQSNWKYLLEWLKEVDVYLTDTEVKNVLDGRGTSLLRLFYQLFLHLDKRDRTNFIKRERKMVSNLVEKIGHRFKVDKLVEEVESVPDQLSKPLLDEKQFIEWQKRKSEQVKDTYNYVRHKYSKMLEKIDEAHTPLQQQKPKPAPLKQQQKKDFENFSLRYPCTFKNYTYEELTELEERAAERKESLTSSEWVKKYMDNLHTTFRKKKQSIEFQKNLRNTLDQSLWDMSVDEEETKLDTELAKKVMKLSQFEKQMCTKIMETKQQARNIAHNRVLAEREFNEERKQQFTQFFDNVKEQMRLEVVELDFEKQRQKMLHKRLYAEKMARKRKHYYEICYETMLSIVDYATKYAYFKRLLGEDEIPEHFIHEWKVLYYKQKAIFDILDPMEDLLKEAAIEEQPAEEEEEIIRLELDRQDALNENEFKEYHNYAGPWTLDRLVPNYDCESEERKYEYLGTRILGHVVFTLLQMKYPYPPVRPPADLPPYSAKALLCGLPDKSVTIPLQKLLNHRKIHVVKLESAINYCLRMFRTEMIGCTDIDLSFDKFINAAQDEDSKELIKIMKAEDDSISKSSDVLGPIPPNTKQTQTPKTIPEEEIVLSAAAGLGKYAYEALCVGDTLTDHLLAAMIVEYLKDQDDIDGFVIINYPNSYREAQILEETFTGRMPPDESNLDDRDDIYLEESIIKHRRRIDDSFINIRVSKIVTDPHKKKEDQPFESYFTCYLKMKETEDILQEFVIWDLTEDNSEFIERFYAALGMNYSLYYEVIEKIFLAQICKYIIGDYVIPMKSSEELFGEGVLSLLQFASSDTKRAKSKIVKPELSIHSKSKEKLKRNSRSQQSKNGLDELEVVKAPESGGGSIDETVIPTIEGVEEHEPTTPSVEEVILAGEEDWEYGDIPIPTSIGVSLATCWEQIEQTYVGDMSDMFLAKRMTMNFLIPYTRFIKDKMEQIITLPAPKQDLVCAFQRQYNEFENDWRDINLTKNEWHCRVKELQNVLYKICDDRKLFAEKQRQALICDNWAMDELTSFVNTYISCMQTELNRTTLTYQILHDFYFAMIKKLPPQDRLTSKDLNRITRESDETSGSKKGAEDKLFRQLRLAFLDIQLNNIEIDYSNNPFNSVIENNVKIALKVIKDLNDYYRTLISREYAEIAKITPVPKKKEDNTSNESISPEEVFKMNALKCIDEWIMGINGEMFRANLRMLALQYRCYRDMKLFNDCIYKTFTEVQNNINMYYINEIKSVDRLCKYFQMAIEGGRRIPETLILEHDTFVIDPNLLQFPPPDTSPPPEEIRDRPKSFEFYTSQLARLRSHFKIVAPTGLALQQAFIYLLQDFIFYGKECCEGPLFPEEWQHIDPEKVNRLGVIIYGETAYVDWRDFLIYALCIRYPTVDELLDLRKKFRCEDLESTELISRDFFISQNLWYEQDFDRSNKSAQLRKNLIKHFLFELYESAEDKMNYSAFLLAFCKSPNPIEGFASALSVVVGKRACYNWDECREIVEKMIRYKQYLDESLACALRCTDEFLGKLIERVVNICCGTSIEELEYVEPPPEEKGKGKKGKNSKAKKADSAQSARSLLQKSGASNSRKSLPEPQVKQTYVCPPCQGEESEGEGEKPIEEEQMSESAQPDPEVAYAVPQEAIWNVLKTCMPWHFVLIPEDTAPSYTAVIQEIMKRLEVLNEHGDIYVSKFVAEPEVCKLLHKVKKFTAVNLVEEVRKITTIPFSG